MGCVNFLTWCLPHNTIKNCLWSVFEFFFQCDFLLLVPADITEIGGEQTVHEGSNLQLTCEALGKPEPNVTWTKEKTGNQGNTGVVQEGKVLTIKKISRNDSGTFNCAASNGFGEVDSQTVHVNVTCEYAMKTFYYDAKRIGTFYLPFCCNVCCHLLGLMCGLHPGIQKFLLASLSKNFKCA